MNEFEIQIVIEQTWKEIILNRIIHMEDKIVSIEKEIVDIKKRESITDIQILNTARQAIRRDLQQNAKVMAMVETICSHLPNLTERDIISAALDAYRKAKIESAEQFPHIELDIAVSEVQKPKHHV